MAKNWRANIHTTIPKEYQGRWDAKQDDKGPIQKRGSEKGMNFCVQLTSIVGEEERW